MQEERLSEPYRNWWTITVEMLMVFVLIFEKHAYRFVTNFGRPLGEENDNFWLNLGELNMRVKNMVMLQTLKSILFCRLKNL